jgi:hypothetical protein
MKTIVFLGVIVLLFNLDVYSQKLKSYKLDDELKEISGLESINDTLFLCHNDGGNEPLIYLINQKGKILKTCTIRNAKNTDWEDLTKDDNGNLYIADIGNNANKRKKVRILKVSIDSILRFDAVNAAVFSFSYPDQTEFPPASSELHYDAESISFFKDSLWIFTKCRAIPFDGKSKVYAIHPRDLIDASWEFKGEIIPGTKSWKYDSFTSSTVYRDTFYTLTYNKLMKYRRTTTSFQLVKKKRFLKFNQRESIAITPNGSIFVANEGHWLLGKQRLINYKNE